MNHLNLNPYFNCGKIKARIALVGTAIATVLMIGCATNNEKNLKEFIEKEEIRQIIFGNKPDLEECYRNTYKENTPTGKIIVSWDIGELGVISWIQMIKNSFDSDLLGSCVIEKMKAWNFPAPPKDTRANVRYGFSFSKKGVKIGPGK